MSGIDLVLFYGTRPQVIKASVLRPALGARWSVHTIDTGQHYDYALNELLYQQLAVEAPDRFLEVGSGTHGQQTGAILERAEAAFLELRPKAVVVIGDTNSTLGGALAAGKLRIPVVHVEAGLRAADQFMAEEINRRVVDAFAACLCSPSARATQQLLRERRDALVVETGDVAYDVLRRQLGHAPDHVQDTPPEYIYATLHRAELTGDKGLLAGVMAGLGGLGLPVVLAVHPRTAAALAEYKLEPPRSSGLRMMPAVGYHESLAFLGRAQAVVTDSGGIQREAYWCGVPCITVREETEWVETVESGANVLVAPRQVGTKLSAAVEQQLAWHKQPARWDCTAYGNGNAAPRVADAVGRLLDGLEGN